MNAVTTIIKENAGNARARAAAPPGSGQIRHYIMYRQMQKDAGRNMRMAEISPRKFCGEKGEACILWRERGRKPI